MPRHCRTANTVSQPSAAPLFAEEKIPDTYNRTEMQQALTRYAATESKQDSKQLPKAAGEGALFQRSLERVIPSGEVQLNLASHDCIIHKQSVQNVLVHKRGPIFRNGPFSRDCVVSQVVQTAHIQSQSVNIVGDLPNNFKVQIGSQDRLYITAASLKEHMVIQLEKTPGSSARMGVIIGGRSVNSATFKDGVGKFEFADGGSLTVKGLQEPSDLIVTDNKATAAAGQFKDIGLFAEKMPQRSSDSPPPAMGDSRPPTPPLAPAPRMKDEKSKDPIDQKEELLAKRLKEMELNTAALEKKVAEQAELLKKAAATNIELNQKVAASTEASTKAQQAAATAEANKQAALKDSEDTIKKLSDDLKAEKAKTKEESTKAESAAATAKGVHETLTKQLKTLLAEQSEILTKLKDKPQVDQPNLSAFLADSNTEKEAAERKILIAGVTDPALKKLLNTLLEQVNQIKHLKDALRLSSRLNSPAIMASLNDLLLGKLTAEEQKRLQAHIVYGPGGVEGYDSYSQYFHETNAKLLLLLDVLEKDTTMTQESKQKAREIFNDLSTQGSRRRLEELDEIAAKKKAAEKKAVESK